MGKAKVRRLNVLAGVLAAAVVFLLGYVLATQNRGDAPPAPEPAPQAQQNPLESLARRDPGDPLAKGRPDAPVVLVNYTDFRCPFCAKFGRDIEPELQRRYVDTGVLRIEWRDFPIFGEESLSAAEAGRAAARQGRFWEFHDAVFAQAPPTGHPPMPRERLVELARQAGVPDIQRFEADMGDPGVYAGIQADAMEGAQLGVSSTPTFVINGQPVFGAQPLEVFTEVIEQARAR
ncbi:protein-disulfide isomerase [Saccharopolyspora erythraea NRRL 2338]|uniref:DsbA-like thioredoxin domain protein n=1 Tax=Saccharopolyspora erythraea (strain ATCC 11635 / DSM 40517 / JCM 4748 / NBRC 13426 / NCIMB 8594 / NRRL 2338) TaxID=405948 RepID=A4F7D8_SACEN|nr:thioredoxin domain-containing protein [Saccharopolyspora erythraea]EQD83598.1 disulfide bond formation protein [Saccharopolyspora erythraea D]PFG93764.1 protein-disulfide isomerase [Saccharopolyspora erythraea NRRL 2338]QRK90601.1 thioredoxin domain-containing protein [Saccharopolyspora erythraea]CAL99962.1 DsbA-like thioredoxin domain protein [Saccharopolyspora erythraea NRRL 2338]